MTNKAFTLNYMIVNTCERTIEVMCKGGMSYSIDKPETPALDKEVILKVELDNVDLTRLDINPELGLTLLDKDILTELKKSVEKIKSEPFINEYRIQHSKFSASIKLNATYVERRGGIHSELLGITIYRPRDEQRISGNVVALNTPMEYSESVKDNSKDNSIVCSFKLNDPERVAPPMWVNLMGKVRRIKTTVSCAELPGLYVTIVEGGLSPKSVYYRLEDLTDKILCENGIFITERAAMEGGNREVLLNAEKRIKELNKEVSVIYEYTEKQNIRISQLEARNTKLSFDVERTKDFSTLKETLHKNEISMLRAKSSSDVIGTWLKNLTAALGLGVTAYKLLC